MKLNLDSKTALRIRGISNIHRMLFPDLQKVFTFTPCPGRFKSVKMVFLDNGTIMFDNYAGDIWK